MSPTKVNSEKVISSIFVAEVAKLIQKDIINGIGEGLIVEHVKFGKGVVVAIDESSNEQQTIEIKFSSGVKKKLDLQICLNNKLLSF
jgi:DNA helicase-2/ATP-dependent DNA helicase PcrA